MKHQTRAVSVAQLRAEAPENASKRIVGYAATFETPTTYAYGGLREILVAGAFRSAITSDDVRALVNHDPNHVLGRSKAGSGTLKLSEDEIGLRFELELPDTQLARDLYTLIARGDVSEMSFSFDYGEEEKRDFNGETVRAITRVSRLWDIAIVTFPAFPNTLALARAQGEHDQPEEKAQGAQPQATNEGDELAEDRSIKADNIRALNSLETRRLAAMCAGR